VRALIGRLWRWALVEEGSTRPVALIRIGLALLIWTRWASNFLLYKATSAVDLAIGLSYFASTTLLLVGACSRAAAAWTAGTLLVLFFHLGGDYIHHHTWLLVASTVLLVFTPCGRSFSLDRWLALRRADRTGVPPPPERGPLWGQRLLAMQVSAVYLWSAASKSDRPFLSGERLQHIFLRWYGSSDPPGFPFFAETMQALAVLTVGLEYALGVGLWFARTRPWAVLLGLVFHAIIYVTLPVFTFSATMILLYLAFFEPEAVDRVIARLTRPDASP
jgi:hypothetical protein